MHPRIPLPIDVEVDGIRCRASDWGPGGLCLTSDTLALMPGEVRQARLTFDMSGFNVTVEVAFRTVWSHDDQSYGVRFVDLTPDQARLLDSLVAGYLRGEALPLQRLFQPIAAEERPRSAAPLPGRLLSLLARLRLVLVLLGGGALVIGLALYVISSRMVVYSDYGAIAGELYLLRAPEAGLLHLAGLRPGQPVHQGQVLGEIEPSVPAQAQADARGKVIVLQAQIDQRSEMLASAQAGFRNLLRTAEAQVKAAADEREAIERQVAAQERTFQRVLQMAKAGWLSYLRADQEEVALQQHLRARAAARANEEAARARLEDAKQGRFVSDGRSTQASPEDIARELQELRTQRDQLEVVAKAQVARRPVPSPCDCTVTGVQAADGTFVSAGIQIATLGREMAAGRQVDTLIVTSRMKFIRVGQRVKVFLPDRDNPVGGNVIVVTYNAGNTGRIGLPDTLRTLNDYGLVTVALDQDAQAAATGQPALLMAPVGFDMVLRSIPGFGWLLKTVAHPGQD
ncbi:PilZ domain-containing protein [Rhodovastum atsumiense]|uniref:PilZ domain-containing protein n=1 Tax=Rhodovastum atsumiense TaxID=504468 RepID=A0A5M6IV09_9PROT|nr:PilZ domain-containing protein [Rhodovastum atsumiense]KAA5612143.1 hypothetical protein F1189_10775 [Rhodovastum atsumiense]CAH2603912.1 PilZ domain-containing protein [Rhodovastum atsumiense]